MTAPAGAARAVVIDIEGTVCPISFVKQVLFPYARAHLPGYVAAHAADAEVRGCLDDARAAAGDPALDDDAVLTLLLQWIDEDRKVTPLKTLQGKVWAAGYQSGELVCPIYDDAAAALRAWHAAGVPLYVYSSGSVFAQRLLFGHTTHGDLTPLLAEYFDTTIGPKLMPGSYRTIELAIARAPGAVLFLSDDTGELDAAAAAGMRTICIDRGEAVIPADTPHRRVSTFAAIDPLA